MRYATQRPSYHADVLNDDLPDEPPRSPTSTRQYHPGTFAAQPEVVAQARRELGTQRASRRVEHPPRPALIPVGVQTDGDEGNDECTARCLAPHVGSRVRPVQRETEDNMGRSHPASHPRRVSWPLKAGVILAALWFLGTSGLSWWDSHVADPALYGPLHGSMVTCVLGGGDSTAQPSKLIAMNNNGQVELIEMLASNPDHTRILVGPNLVASGLPDPGTANVEMQVVEQDGHQIVRVTVWSDSYTLPFIGRIHQ